MPGVHRRERILSQVNRRGAIRVGEIADDLSVSYATAHRDLRALDARGLLRVVRGGAVACDGGSAHWIAGMVRRGAGCPSDLPVFEPVTVNGRQWQIQHGIHRAVVCQRGGALRSYEVAGHPIVDDDGDDEPTAYHGAVLAPWPNRIASGRWSWRGRTHETPINDPATNSALHGLLAWVPWQPIRVNKSGVKLSATVLPQPGYPFSVQVWVTWSVSDVGLRCDLAALNVGREDAPFGAATHPYFMLPRASVDDLSLTLPATSWQRTDRRLHPTVLAAVGGTRMDYREGRALSGMRLDTAYTNLIRDPSRKACASLSDGRDKVHVWADDAFAWWQVYTSDHFPTTSQRYRTAVALEAMTCGPNAFNTGRDLIVLAPGQRWTGRWGARLEAA